MEKLTVKDRLARQRVVWDALFTATERHCTCKLGTPERLEWAFIREACRRESIRLLRIAARQRREQAA